MCCIIDTNCFTKVFNPNDAEHERFRHIFKWVTEGGGSMIYGGTTYNREVVDKMRKFGRLLADLKRKRRLVKLDDAKVDAVEDRLKNLIQHKDFDDPHLVAMVTVSKCRVVATGDTRCLPFLRNRKLYPRGMKVPEVYSTENHAGLCCDKYLSNVCLNRDSLSHGPNKRKPKARPGAARTV